MGHQPGEDPLVMGSYFQNKIKIEKKFVFFVTFFCKIHSKVKEKCHDLMTTCWNPFSE